MEVLWRGVLAGLGAVSDKSDRSDKSAKSDYRSPPVVCIQTYGIGVIGLYGFFVSLLRGFGRLIILIRD